ncbi:hypothetical protein [Actinomadura geliboluensis]|uniref:hypothetical protein n=1 Tax=Actinomadura geliboluensis TaxID=882440 RepID=UPI002637B0E0|nr:hypothetical protein [Actinomadura geliboluensis]
MSLLKPDVSIPVALATGALVYGVYNLALPSVADVRTSAEQHPDVEAANRMAAWTSAVAVAGISLIARDMNVFIVGGGMTIALAWWYKHADAVIPEISRAIPDFGGEPDMVEPDAAMGPAF